MPVTVKSQGLGNVHQAMVTAAHSDLVVKLKDIEQFLTDWGKQNHSPQTVEQYRTYLMRFYAYLPKDHTVRRDTVRNWRKRLLQSGYAPNTVNLHISACNTWLEYMGRREYQLLGQLSGSGKDRTALTREEYFRLLLAARAQGQERLFLMVKVFGGTGLYARELANVTVEAVRAGWLSGTENGRERRIRLSDGLRGELLAYAEREGVVFGPIFLTREGNPIDRTTAAVLIRRLGEEAGIPDGHATPSGLRLMYLANRAEVEADAARMVEQTLERQAAQEQLIVGWAL